MSGRSAQRARRKARYFNRSRAVLPLCSRRLCSLRFRDVGGLGARLWLLAVLLALVVPVGGRAADPSPTVVVSAPARAAVGEPIVLRLSVAGSPGVAGYEAQLLFDENAARLTEVDNRHNSVARLGWDVRDLGPVELTNGFMFGSYACRSEGCTGGGSTTSRGASGDALLARVGLRADRPGLLQLRFSGIRLVDATGSYVEAAGGEQLVTVEVTGRGARAHTAPSAPPSHREQSRGKKDP